MQKNKTLVNRAMKAMFVAGFAATMFPVQALAGGSANTFVQAQQNAVKGTVVDEFGKPMIGVTIMLKGSQGGTITDMDGNFSIKAKAGETLQLSYAGYKTQTIKVGSGAHLNIKMEPDAVGLDNVVVIGYGTMKKRDLTGAITSVKNEDITLSPTSNAMEALQGKVAGLDITRSSGQAGATPTIQLRGNRSLTASGNPLYLIDGMPGDINTLNPNDIESIEVLKDASSTAIYGSQGANGIIIVTTKSGKEGKAKVNFNAYLGINGWSTVPEVYHGADYFNLRKLAKMQAGQYTTDDTVFDSAVYDAYLRGEDIDWADALLKTGVTQNYSVSVSGGTEKTKAYMSFNFNGEEGQYANDNNKIYSTNLRIDHKVNNWLSTGVNMQGSYQYRNMAYAKLDRAIGRSPIGSLYDEDGNVNVRPVAGDNMVSLLVNNKGNYRNNSQDTRIYLNPYLRFTPLKGLTFETRLNISLGYSKANKFEGIGSYSDYDNAGNGVDTNKNVYASVGNTNTTNYKWENILTYNLSIADKHNLTFTGVTSWNHNRKEYSYAYQNNLASNAYLWHGIGSNTQYTDAKTTYTMSKGLSYVGRVNYSYEGKYMASFSLRADGSSRLAKGNKWDTFPAFSAGWRISEEKFMESTRSWLDNLKLRVGYGVTGTASIGEYSSQSVYTPVKVILGNQYVDGYRFSTNEGSAKYSIANLNLGWEKSKSWNIGVDMAMFNGRVDLNLDYYYTKTEDVIYNRNLPVTNGAFDASNYYNTYMNICETKNNGFEVALTTRNITDKEVKGFTWTSNITFAAYSEEISKLTSDNTEFITNGDGGNVYYKGHPVNSYYHYKLLGAWRQSEAADAEVFGALPGDLHIDIPGMIKVEDGKFTKNELDENNNIIYYTKDNKYTPSGNDYQVLGHNTPDWTLGFKNTFIWKNFDLSVYMYMRWGQTIKSDLVGSYDPTAGGNFPTHFDYWTTETGDAYHYFPALNSAKSLETYTGYYALQFVNGSFFKIKNITLGYTLPTNIAKKIGIENFRIYGTITNPLVVAKSDLLKNYDPEMNGSINYPLTKQLVFGVNLTF